MILKEYTLNTDGIEVNVRISKVGAANEYQILLPIIVRMVFI